MTCGTLSDPPNGKVELNGSDPGDLATYTCLEGFQATGGAVERVCTQSGEWSGVIIKCEGMSTLHTPV